jgi:hypothetical protein
MNESFLTFHTFTDPALANEFEEILHDAGIELILEKEAPLLDKQWIGSTSDPDIIIKIKPVDFNAAHQCLQNYFDKHINEIRKDYFLFSFTNDELLEVIQKTDEWGDLNYRLAQKILSDRGVSPDVSIIQKLKHDRIDELSKPEKTDWGIISTAYFFLLAGIVFLLPIVEAGFGFSPFGFIICLLLGRHLAYNKKILPDGSTALTYNSFSRRHGKIIIVAAIVLLSVSVIAWLNFFSDYF